MLPGDQITLTAQAIDNVRVDTVTFEVDGANPTETSTEPFQRAIVVPAVASPGTQILVKATATDPSGNTGSAEATLTINARPDTEKPTIRLNAPTLASPGTSLHLSASADDNSGIQSVNFSINGASLVTLTQPPYEVTYDIPPDTPVGSALAAGAFALDFSANRSDAAATINIVETPDTVPPTVVLTAGATVAPGAVLSLTASAFDGRGVSKVDFYVDGVKIASDTQAPYAAAFHVPENAQAGRSLQLEARAVDFSGLEGTDSRQALIVSASSLADGVMTGEVYDDTSGLPVAGATITLTGVDAGGRAYSQSASSDSRGRYLLHATEGTGVLRVARDGWTRVDRSGGHRRQPLHQRDRRAPDAAHGDDRSDQRGPWRHVERPERLSRFAVDRSRRIDRVDGCRRDADRLAGSAGTAAARLVARRDGGYRAARSVVCRSRDADAGGGERPAERCASRARPVG